MDFLTFIAEMLSTIYFTAFLLILRRMKNLHYLVNVSEYDPPIIDFTWPFSC